MEYELNPSDFNPQNESSGCIIENNGKIVMLKRKEIRNTLGFVWGIPAGKIKKGETPEEALIREIKEETGLELKSFQKIETFKIRLSKKKYDFVYNLFKSKTDTNKIAISKEHNGYVWVNKEEAKKLNLEIGADIYLNHIN